jgi:hypothetical protein
MRQPVDYPLKDDDRFPSTSVDEMTYAALLDRHDAELRITEEMIRSACRRIEAAQQFPFAQRPNFLTRDQIGLSTDAEIADAGKSTGQTNANRLLSRWTRIIS